MTTLELQERIGQRARLCVETSLTVVVQIRDARTVYGRTDYLVTPVEGSGEQWVSADRVTVKD